MFKVGQEKGLKLDPVQDLVDVARDMRYARNQKGAKLVTVDELLTAQQIQSYFLRRASKLWHSQSDDPESEQDEDVILAAEEELAHQNVHTVVLNEVALRHPVVFDVFNLCDMHGSGKLQQLSVAMLRSICEHFDIDVENIEGRRDAPSLSLLREFLESCDCHHSACL